MHDRNIYERTQDLKDVAVIRYQLGSYFYVKNTIDKIKEKIRKYDEKGVGNEEK